MKRRPPACAPASRSMSAASDSLRHARRRIEHGRPASPATAAITREMARCTGLKVACTGPGESHKLRRAYLAAAYLMLQPYDLVVVISTAEPANSDLTAAAT